MDQFAQLPSISCSVNATESTHFRPLSLPDGCLQDTDELHGHTRRCHGVCNEAGNASVVTHSFKEMCLGLGKLTPKKNTWDRMMDDEYQTWDEKLQLYRSKPQNRYILYESIVPYSNRLAEKNKQKGSYSELISPGYWLGPNPLFSGLQQEGVFFRLLLQASRGTPPTTRFRRGVDSLASLRFFLPWEINGVGRCIQLLKFQS